jgi:hypothetical protein
MMRFWPALEAAARTLKAYAIEAGKAGAQVA